MIKIKNKLVVFGIALFVSYSFGSGSLLAEQLREIPIQKGEFPHKTCAKNNQCSDCHGKLGEVMLKPKDNSKCLTCHTPNKGPVPVVSIRTPKGNNDIGINTAKLHNQVEKHKNQIIDNEKSTACAKCHKDPSKETYLRPLFKLDGCVCHDPQAHPIENMGKKSFRHSNDGNNAKHVDFVACKECHKEGDDEFFKTPQKNSIGCSKCHGVEDIKTDVVLKTKHMKKLNGAVFPHKGHKTVVVSCEQCHKGIQRDMQVEEKLVLTARECFDCHEFDIKKYVKEMRPSTAPNKQACGACHDDKIMSGIINGQPPSHKNANWMTRHGVVREISSEKHGKSCETCHGEDKKKCAQCHQDKEKGKPNNHNALWTNRVHGYGFELNNDRCLTCHTGVIGPMWCTSCHKTTPPMNHRGLWVTKTHGEIADDGADGSCMMCHKLSPELSCTKSGCHDSSNPLKKKRSF